MEQQFTARSMLSVKLIIGLSVATLGVLMTLDNFDVIDSGPILQFWPVVLIVVGLIKLADPFARAFGIVAIVAGGLLLIFTAGHRLGLHDLWALLLVGFGIVLVLQSLGVRPKAFSGGDTVWGILSNQRTVITAPDFSRLNAVSFLGGAEIDLTAAEMKQSPAVIDVFVLMGAVELYVPDGWEVLSEAVPFMGGIDMNSRSRGSGKQLIVRGFVMMGGIDIKGFAARRA